MSQTRRTQTSLSPAAAIRLTRAAERPDRRLDFHCQLPTGGHHEMIEALLRDGAVVGVVWRRDLVRAFAGGSARLSAGATPV